MGNNPILLTVLALGFMGFTFGALILEPDAQPCWAIGLPLAAIWLLVMAINASRRQLDQLLEDEDHGQGF